MWSRGIGRAKWGVLFAAAAVAGTGWLNGCGYQAATPAERAEILAALQKYEATEGGVIMNATEADVKVRADSGTARYVISFPGGQIASLGRRARLVKSAGGWAVEDVEPKEVRK